MSLSDFLRNIANRMDGQRPPPPPIDTASHESNQGQFHAPPNTKPLLVKSQVATFPEMPGLRFERSEMTFADDNAAEYTKSISTRHILPGCGCAVSGPDKIAYISDISGLPVCKRCAKICACGHKVAPRERIRLENGQLICAACQQQLQKQARKAKIATFFLGGLFK